MSVGAGLSAGLARGGGGAPRTPPQTEPEERAWQRAQGQTQDAEEDARGRSGSKRRDTHHLTPKQTRGYLRQRRDNRQNLHEEVEEEL